MGTSQSSDGPGQGVPMVPPWTPTAPQDPVPPDGVPDTQLGNDPDNGNQALTPATPQVAFQPPPAQIAPARRFGGVRSSLGNFARSGDVRDLRRSLGHYVRGGYGGSNIAAGRFGGTAETAASFSYALNTTASGDPGAPIDATALAGRSTEEIATAIIEAVRPIDGTQDAEAERAAMHDAMSDLLSEFPNANLLSLSDPEREFVIERFTAIDVARRFELDVGKALLERAPTATVALARLKQMRSYIKEAVAASFRKLQERGRTLTPGRVARVVQSALRDTFEVFEGYEE